MVLDEPLNQLPATGEIDHSGAVVLVTGGAGNVGKGVTRAFLDAGARVAVPLYHREATTNVAPLVNEYGDRLTTISLDLTTERGAEQAVRHVKEWGGRLNCVVHLIGGFEGGTAVADSPVEVWNRMMTLNLTSAFLTARYALPALIESGGGTLVFISSRSAFQEQGNRAAYAAAKAGLVALAKAIALEYADQNIRCNVVVPDTIATPENRQTMPGADEGEWVSPERVEQTILYLASKASAPLTGAAIPVFPA